MIKAQVKSLIELSFRLISLLPHPAKTVNPPPCSVRCGVSAPAQLIQSVSFRFYFNTYWHTIYYFTFILVVPMKESDAEKHIDCIQYSIYFNNALFVSSVCYSMGLFVRLSEQWYQWVWSPPAPIGEVRFSGMGHSPVGLWLILTPLLLSLNSKL